MTLSYMLIGDGSSDRVLLPIIDWVLRRAGHFVTERAWAADAALAGARSLHDRVHRAVEVYPCDVLFIHRDAETMPPAQRLREIQEATAALANRHVAVVPVRMTEAWLLHDERAIRTASGNPGGRSPLDLPRVADLERVVDAKATLFGALQAAADLGARRTRLPARSPA